MGGVGVAMAVLVAVGASPVLAQAAGSPALVRPPAMVALPQSVVPFPAVSRAGAAAVNLNGVRVALMDRGPAADVGRVRGVLPSLLTTDGAIDRTGAQRHPATRALLIEQVWDPTLVARRAARTAATPYSDNTFVVTRWQGIRVEGRSATVTLRGHQRLRSGGLTWDLPDRQFWVQLVQSGGRWRLAVVAPTDGSDDGCCVLDRIDPGADPTGSAFVDLPVS